MKKSAIKSAGNWWIMAALAVFVSSTGIARAASEGSDRAGNYTSVTFTNGSNEGTGFGPWEFNVGEGSAVGLTNSAAGSDDINSTNGLSFYFYGGTNGSFGEAIRPLSSPMIEGDEITATIAYNFSGGARGINVLDASNNELLNVNFGGSDELSYTFAGSSGVVIASNYLSDASIVFTIIQLAGNELELDIERNDGFFTNVTSSGLSAPAAKFKFYNGGHAGDNISYALFVNDLEITESTIPTLALNGPDAMAVGMTNQLITTRGGLTESEAVGFISNSAPSVATVPSLVTFDGGVTETNFSISGDSLGTTTIEITAESFPTATLSVAVYDLGYDDSYYAAGSFTNGGNSGLGFDSWILIDNAGSGDGFTNFAGAFIGDSTSGGSDVNAGFSGDSFGLFANGEGDGGPLSQAIRPFGADLGVGEVVSFELGVNFRNGSKGAVLQNSGAAVFEVGISGDDYWYINHNDGAGVVSLGWTNYSSDTVIAVEVARVSGDFYEIALTRSGGISELVDLGLVDLGSTAPNEIRFYVFDTDAGDENNLYFNSLARYSGDVVTVLTLDGNDGMIQGQTNTFRVERSGSTDAPLTVTLASDDSDVVLVTNEVVLGIGVTSVTFDVVGGITNGAAGISATAVDTVGDTFSVDVYDIAYDDTTYYPPATFDTNGNGGVGFELWEISDNAGEGDGYTNFAGVFLGASAFSADVNSSDDTAFALFANQQGGGGNPLVEAVRPLSAELGIGESLTFEMAVNFRNGAKGVMIQNGGTWLLEIAVFGDDYVYNIRDGGADSPVSLGWDYAADTLIEVTLSRSGAGTYNLQLERSGSSPESTLIEGIALSVVPDRARFYVFDTEAGAENNLYINFLAVSSGIVGGAFTDGIPDSWWSRYSIDPVDRVATNNLDGDVDANGEPFSNVEEYIADTDPTDISSFYPNRIEVVTGSDVFMLEAGPTTNSRVYDIWWTTDLLAEPQDWTRLGLNVPGDAGGGSVMLEVSNDAPSRVYRTGVAIP